MRNFRRVVGTGVVVAGLVAAIAGTVLAGGVPGLETEGALVRGSEHASHMQTVASVGMTVSNLPRAVGFYTEVLGFEEVEEVEVGGDGVEHLLGVFGARCRIARLSLGGDRLELTEFLTPRGEPVPGDSRSNDRWFQHVAIVVSDIERAYAHLREHNVTHASTGPQRLPEWNRAAGGIAAFYFNDPDGHVLECIHFPEGKGDPKWRRASGDLMLGIDHTAIVVADTDRSLAFYRDTLGMAVAGESENYGVEQEHLNNVFGARLRITALRAASGPGIELLEYLSPSDGRDYPRDARACDLIHWQTTCVVDDVETVAKRVRGAGGRWVSPGAVSGVERIAGGSRAALVRDPDGHAVLLRSAGGETGH